VEDSHANLFSPALKSTIKKYQIRPDFLEKATVFNKGLFFGAPSLTQTWEIFTNSTIATQLY
jgi:hypothetical protein